VRFDVITLFPEFIGQATSIGVVGRARERGLIEVAAWNPRDYAEGGYRKVDERPFGGGPGMVMLEAPLARTLAAARQAGEGGAAARLVYLSPQGARLTQRRVEALASERRLILFCGRYEGVDQRFIDREVDEELSIGDYVLSGGELAAAVVIDAVARLLDGALGNAESAARDSFGDGLLDCPHYTRPERIGVDEVPAVLLSGDHRAIARWRRREQLGRTWLRRPDLLARVALDASDRALLDEYRREWLARARLERRTPESADAGGRPDRRSASPSGADQKRQASHPTPGASAANNDSRGEKP
jgi:tRNA (guanine37-N1)-methyltransferase